MRFPDTGGPVAHTSEILLTWATETPSWSHKAELKALNCFSHLLGLVYLFASSACSHCPRYLSSVCSKWAYNPQSLITSAHKSWSTLFVSTKTTFCVPITVCKRIAPSKTLKIVSHVSSREQEQNT